MVLLVFLLSGIPGPVVGMLLFIPGLVSIEAAGWISGVLYAITYPIAIIASTLFYLRLREGMAAATEPHHAVQRWNWPWATWGKTQPTS